MSASSRPSRQSSIASDISQFMEIDGEDSEESVIQSVVGDPVVRKRAAAAGTYFPLSLYSAAQMINSSVEDIELPTPKRPRLHSRFYPISVTQYCQLTLIAAF